MTRRRVGDLAFRLDEVFGREVWNVGWARTTPERLRRGDLGPVTWLPQAGRRGEGHADPFFVPGEGRAVYVEHIPGWEGPGRLARLELDAAEGHDLPEFAGSGHLSFPYTFEEAGEVYCLPEAHSDGVLRLWRRQGGRWRPDRVLLHEPAVDAAVVRFEGQWWLFYGVEGPLKNVNCYLARARDLDGPWVAHPQNPVISDVTLARGGGRLSIDGHGLLRIAQDCSRRYGGALAVTSVQVDPQRFGVRVLARVAPSAPWPDGMHTLDHLEVADGEVLCVVDGLRRSASLTRVARRAVDPQRWRARRPALASRVGVRS